MRSKYKDQSKKVGSTNHYIRKQSRHSDLYDDVTALKASKSKHITKYLSETYYALYERPVGSVGPFMLMEVFNGLNEAVAAINERKDLITHTKSCEYHVLKLKTPEVDNMKPVYSRTDDDEPDEETIFEF